MIMLTDSHTTSTVCNGIQIRMLNPTGMPYLDVSYPILALPHQGSLPHEKLLIGPGRGPTVVTYCCNPESQFEEIILKIPCIDHDTLAEVILGHVPCSETFRGYLGYLATSQGQSLRATGGEHNRHKFMVKPPDIPKISRVQASASVIRSPSSSTT